MSNTEQLMKDALSAIQKLQSENQVLRSGLAKARDTKPATVADAIAKALRNPQGHAQNAWHLLPAMAEAQKVRKASPAERVARAEELLRKASGR